MTDAISVDSHNTLILFVLYLSLRLQDYPRAKGGRPRFAEGRVIEGEGLQMGECGQGQRQFPAQQGLMQIQQIEVGQLSPSYWHGAADRVVIKGQRGQGGQVAQFRREAASEGIVREPKLLQARQATEFRRKGSPDGVLIQPQNFQIGQIRDSRRECAGQMIRIQIQGRHMPVRANDPIPGTGRRRLPPAGACRPSCAIRAGEQG